MHSIARARDHLGLDESEIKDCERFTATSNAQWPSPSLCVRCRPRCRRYRTSASHGMSHPPSRLKAKLLFVTRTRWRRSAVTVWRASHRRMADSSSLHRSPQDWATYNTYISDSSAWLAHRANPSPAVVRLDSPAARRCVPRVIPINGRTGTRALHQRDAREDRPSPTPTS